jgi:outer membrane protein
MKTRFLLPAILVVLFFAKSIATGEEPGRIGLIDLQRVVQESKEGKRAFEALKKKKDLLQQRLDTKEKELLDLRKEFDKQSMMLSMDAQQDRKKTIERKARELEYMLKDLNDEMRRAQESEQNRILKELESIIENIGKDGKYAIILERRAGGVLYSAKLFDLTDEVIAAYDKVKAQRE